MNAITAPNHAAKVAHLLEELCTDLGFCLAGRDPTRFETLTESGVDAFTDAVLAAEGLNPETDLVIRRQVRSLVDSHFLGW
jgi:hypothetical protein